MFFNKRKKRQYIEDWVRKWLMQIEEGVFSSLNSSLERMEGKIDDRFKNIIRKDELIDSVVVRVNENEQYLESEEFLDKIVDRINRKQLAPK